jgi:mannose/fructose/N-acetylgalactosamine-specific phosphotransferase system component IIB
MATLGLVRIDGRLIHGQVVTQWIKSTGVNRIIIIDEQITSDPFMSQIFMMAAPPGIKLELMTKKTAAELWQKDKFGQGNIMVMFRDVAAAYETFKLGFNYPKLQLGGLGGAPGRVAVVGPITLDATDAGKLAEIEKEGCDIVFQVTPSTNEVDWKSVKSKYFPKL